MIKDWKQIYWWQILAAYLVINLPWIHLWGHYSKFEYPHIYNDDICHDINVMNMFSANQGKVVIIILKIVSNKSHE